MAIDLTNVVRLPVVTKLDLDSDMTLQNLQGKLDGFILAGYDKEGQMFFSTTFADAAVGLWLLEQCKISLLNTS